VTYSYTLDNRLASISQGTSTTTYQYDPYGRRISKTVDGETTWFVWDNESRLLAEYSEDSSTSTAELTQLYSYVPGEYAPSQVTDGNGNYQVVSDHLSTPKLLVDIDSEAIVWQATKAAFGTTSVDEDVDGDGVDVTFNFRFSGQYEDAETGLYYNYYRYYDPELGRYIQSDPIGLNGGLNTYGYVSGNPVIYADPYGLDACYVLYPDYPITYAEGKSTTILGGHAGVLGYDENGSTKYYEYGRYSSGGQYGYLIGETLPSNDGNYRRVTVPDLVLDENGTPTPESLARLSEELSKRAGHNTKTELTCNSDADEDSVYEFLESSANNSNRKKYSWTPFFSNHCRSVAKEAIKQGTM
jgi:RHS repeat-associated protein